MGVDIYKNRTGYNLRCRYKLINNLGEDLEYKEGFDGIFYAKKESQMSVDKNFIGRGFIISNTRFVISTVDDVTDIVEATIQNMTAIIYIDEFDKEYLVENTQFEVDEEELYFAKAKYAGGRTYLELRERQ